MPESLQQPSANGWLDAATFENVVESAPLISIDLLVQNEHGEFLLGLRNNRPAQGFWFVPGGRVQKNETLDAAFRRLTNEELGIQLEKNQAQFKGVYEHFYQDSVFGEYVSTHYVVLAYRFTMKKANVELSAAQHNNIAWQLPDAILANPQVHGYTKHYFNGA